MSTETYKANPLQIGTYPVVMQSITLSGGGIIAAGTPIKSTDGLAGTVAAAPADYATVIGVTAFDVDLTAGSVSAVIFVSGQFSAAAMILGTMVPENLNAALRLSRTPIFIQ